MTIETRKKYHDLLPTQRADLYGYQDALDYAMNHDDIQNIALAGSYGSGKSSMMKSYEALNGEKHFIHISLADFQEQQKTEQKTKEQYKEKIPKHSDFEILQEDEESESRLEIVNRLEGKILNQLLHQIDPKAIPKSHFRVKQTANKKVALTKSVVTTVFVALLLLALRFHSWESFVASLTNNRLGILLSWTATPIVHIIVVLVCFVIAGVSLYCLMNKYDLQTLLKRVNIKDVSIEVFQEADDSFFDRYLNEVLYLFEQSEADAIVFEDLDRYEVTEIFEKLREISNLLHQRKRQTWKENDGSRAPKFFYLLRDDMFTVTERTKFFDFIIPVVPIVATGNAYDILTTRFAEVGKKDMFSANFLRTVSLHLSDMRLIHNIINEYLVYEERIWTHDLEREPEKQLAMIIYKNLYPYDFTQLQHGKGYVFQLLKNIAEMLAERKREIEEKIAAFDDTSGGDSIASLEKLQNELWIANMDKLQFTELDEDFWFLAEYPDIQKSEGYELLKYLIQNEYIDENYPLYSSYFYPENLTVRDKKYVLAVNNRKKPQFDYHLDNPQKVLEWLEPSLLTRNSSYNYDLFEFLLEHKDIRNFNVRQAWDKWLDGTDYFSKLDTEAFSFAINLWDRTSHQAYLVQIINSRKPDWFGRWTKNELLDEVQWLTYAVQSLENSSCNTLLKMNVNNWLTDAISHNRDFLKIDILNIEKTISSLKALHVKFVDLDFSNPDDLPLVKRLYQDNIYELNSVMLTTCLVQFFGVDENVALKKSYTYVYEKQDSPLWNRIQEELEHYLKVILAEKNVRFSDSPEAAINLINSPNIDSNLKKRYIQRLDTRLEKLIEINNDLWSELLINDCMAFSWDNIIQYYIENCEKKPALDSILVGYLEKGDKELEFKWTDFESHLKERVWPFLRKLVECTSLSLDRYRCMLKPLDFQYDNLPITTLPDANMNILLELGIVKMTTKNMAIMRKSYPNHLADFIFHDGGNEYIHLAESKKITFGESELSELLADKRMKDKIAFRLLDVFDKVVPLREKSYSDHVKVYVIKNYFDIDDIPWLLNSYNSMAFTVQNAFIAHAQKYPDELVRAVQTSKTIPVPVYAACLDYISADKLELIRKYLDNENFELVCTTQKRPIFRDNDDVRRILEYFYEQGWISSYKLMEPGIYRAFSKSHGTVA